MANNTWATADSGSWTEKSRWIGGGGVPNNSGDGATVTASAGSVTSPYTVALDANETIGALTLSQSAATLAIASNTLAITNSGGQAGTANLMAGHLTLAGGSITATGGISVGKAADIIGTGTIGGSGGLSGTGVVRAKGGTLTISVNINDASRLQMGAGKDTLALGGALTGSDTITFQSSADTLALTSSTAVSSFASPANAITLAGFAPGDKIHIGSGTAVTNVAVSHPSASTTDLTVSLSGGGKAMFHLNSPEAGLVANWTRTDISMACYLGGTRISTARGEVAVEDLRVGDLLVTHTGEAHPIRWIGVRDYVTRLIPTDERQTLLPIRFVRGALGAGLPRRDLFLSPEHCVSLQGVLVPARELVNGRTIDYFGDLEVIRYFHPELSRHSVIYAEGAAVETYLDTGNRNMFANALDSLLCAEPVSSEPCQPIVASGPILAEIRFRLAAEAAVLEVASAVWAPLAALRVQPQHLYCVGPQHR